jgi:hypothetical protein
LERRVQSKDQPKGITMQMSSPETPAPDSSTRSQALAGDAADMNHGAMRKIFYAGGHVLTGDRTCKAVLRLARALANNGRADIVDIPVINRIGLSGVWR